MKTFKEYINETLSFEKIFLDILKNRKIIYIEQEKKQKKRIETIEIKISNFIERI